jgi:hypothetical protein
MTEDDRARFVNRLQIEVRELTDMNKVLLSYIGYIGMNYETVVNVVTQLDYVHDCLTEYQNEDV